MQDPILFTNSYQCACGETWTAVWSSACDDRCPRCGALCPPHKSEELDEDKQDSGPQ